MKPDSEDFKQLVYVLMYGTRNLEDYPVQESQYVENEFKLGNFCSMAYREIYHANQRLCKRLNVNEDIDVECIISNLLDMQHYLCMKMYDYGVFFTQKHEDNTEERLIQLYRNLDETKRGIESLEECLTRKTKGQI